MAQNTFDFSHFWSNLKTKLDTKLNKSDVDSTLSPTSENPVQNKVLTGQIGSLVDKGAKNLLKINSKSVTVPSYVVPSNTEVILSEGNYIISFFSNKNALIRVVLSSDNEDLKTIDGTIRPGKNEFAFSLSEKTTKLRWYVNAPCQLSEIMLCTAEDYEASPEFVPYAMSNGELTEDNAAAMIYRRNIGSGQLLSSHLDSGVYSYSGNPSDGAWYGTAYDDFGMLEVFNMTGNSNYIMQRQTSFEQNKVAFRASFNGGNSFGSWKVLTSQS